VLSEGGRTGKGLGRNGLKNVERRENWIELDGEIIS